MIYEVDISSGEVTEWTVDKLVEMLNNTQSISESYFYTTLEDAKRSL